MKSSYPFKDNLDPRRRKTNDVAQSHSHTSLVIVCQHNDFEVGAPFEVQTKASS